MNYRSFEDLPVWQAAIEFALQVFDFISEYEQRFRGFGDVRNQLERAVVSISNNTAEGFERGTNNELIYFLYVARGSAGESRSMLSLCERSPRFSDVRERVGMLKSQAKNISRQLFGWIESLKKSKEKGERHFTFAEKDSRRMG